MSILRREEFEGAGDDQGKVVLRLIDVDTGEKTFRGRAIIDHTITMTNGQKSVSSKEVPFPIKAKSIKEAFKNFETSIKGFLKELQAEIQGKADDAPQVVVPGQKIINAISGDNGRRGLRRV